MSGAPHRLALVLLLASSSLAAAPDEDPTQAPAQGPIPPPPAAPSKGLSRWFNPATAPFIPVPEIAVDPDSGTTLGVIPTWVKTDENNQVRRIIAPDLIYNAHFGWGTHGRIYGYTSGDEQWSLVAGRQGARRARVRRRVSARPVARGTMVVQRQRRLRCRRHSAFLWFRQQFAGKRRYQLYEPAGTS